MKRATSTLRATIAALAAVAVAAALASCDLLRIAPFAVTGCSPSEGYLADPAAATVRVEFSADADREKAERAFSLRSESETIYGAYEWEGGRAFVFRPWKALGTGHDYKIVVSTVAEDGTGISLAREFTRRFTTKLDGERPRVLGSDPADGGVLPSPLAALRIELSEDVERGKFLGAASISPAIQGAWTFPAPDPASPRFYCVFTPSAEWAQKTDYTLSLAKSYADSSGNELLEEFKARFAYSADAADIAPPALLSVANRGKPGDPPATLAEHGADGGFDAGWERDWGIAFAWNEEVEVGGFLGSIALEPYAALEIDLAPGSAMPEYASSIAVRFPDGLKRGQLYSLGLKKGVKDRAGNATAVASTYRFKVDGLLTAPPALERIDFPQDPGSDPKTSFTLADAYSASKTIPLSLTKYLPAGSSGWIDVYVSVASGAGFSLTSFMDSFRIELVNLGGSATIWKVLDASSAAPDYTSPNPAAPPSSVTGREIVRVRAFFYFNYDATKNGCFLFSLRGGFEDARASATAEDIALPIIVAVGS